MGPSICTPHVKDRVNGLVDERARSGGTLAHGLDRALEDAALPLHQLG